jgi:hypothetical protein
MSGPICFVCRRKPVEIDVPRDRFSVCRACWDENWVGWAREHETLILKHLQEQGLPVPTRNVAYLFPRS